MVARLFARSGGDFAAKIMNFKSESGHLHGEPRQDAQTFAHSACQG
jgi:hypothetical protein